MAEEKNTGVQPAEQRMPCLAKVISHLDTTYMGSLEVQLLLPGAGNDSSSGQVQQVKYLSPFWGTTSVDYVAKDNDYNNTQKSYGMWMVPPDVGSLVVVIFLNGTATDGYWIGCVPVPYMNFMVPGNAATQNAIGVTTTDGSKRPGRVPVAEYNKLANVNDGDASQFKKPIHPFTGVLQNQGLLGDDIRGITTSSARREVPSMVFGISTPGPFDKQTGAKMGTIGKSDSPINNAPVSHLGGSTFVMDDGDDKFLRKGPAGSSPPVYAAVEQGDTTGNSTIPHNELIRLRTRTGHQILLHNSEDLIYIGNARGTTWIELTSNGKIDIFANDSISVHTKNDLNFTADRDINFNAAGSINLNATANIYASAASSINLKAAGDANISGAVINVSGATTNIGGGTVNLSGSIISADITGKISCAAQAGVAGGIGGVSIVSGSPGAPAAATMAMVPSRVPQAEPWSNHENLDPSMFTPEKTLAAYAGTTPKPPAAFGQYTTITDPFNKVIGTKK